jgi:hypothetical protein
MSGGPAKDGIKSIDDPKFIAIKKVKNLTDNSPVITVQINGDARAYPVEILMFHEIVNDIVGGKPILVTYCSLCNSSIIFDRRVGNKVLEFGVSGKLRNSDMIMYDRQTQSWWQQFLGLGIVGKMNKSKLKQVPARIESFALFKQRHKDGKVLKGPKVISPYGKNPYVGYDSIDWPFLFKGQYKESIPALSYVVMVGQDAWPLELVRRKGKIKYQNIVISWTKGQNSALDKSNIDEGKDVGNVVVTRDGKLINYSVPFAFAFKAFYPKGVIRK